mmetsp:Transcript_6045/g.11480  ORF Transcript_6045/g.11480 Transcript_6045/m.11480 type:complete len:344 (+) Transcript_6045:194-1225(+)
MWSSSRKRQSASNNAAFGPGQRTISLEQPAPVFPASSDKPRDQERRLSPSPSSLSPSSSSLTSCRVCRSVLDRLERVEKDRDSLKVALVAKETEMFKLTSTSFDSTSASVDDSITMKKAGEQIAEANARHRMLAAEMERDSLRWRNDMAMKVAKFALMCKELSEDNARHKEALRFSTQEISKLESERNSLAKLNQELSVKLAEISMAQSSPSHAPMPSPSSPETEQLENMVEMLASRLEKAMALVHKLRDERSFLLSQAQANQTSHFQSSASNPNATPQSSAHSHMLVKTLSAQLSNERATSKNALLQVSKARTESVSRERELLDRIKSLEEELKLALTNTPT